MKRLLMFFTALTALAMTTTSGFAAELAKLKVGYLPTSGHLLYFVAKEKGFFQREGLNVELFRFTRRITPGSLSASSSSILS